MSLSGLKLPELQALFVMGGETPLEALKINRTVEDSLLKLLTSLPRAYQQQATEWQSRLYIDSKRWNQVEEELPYLQMLQQAVWQNQVLLVDYLSSDQSLTTRQLEPYGLVVKTHIWYLVARRVNDDDYRIYRVSRFKQVKVTDKLFQRESDFDLQAVWHEKRAAFEHLIRADYTVTFSLPDEMIQALDYFIADRYRITETGWANVDHRGAIL